nr:MAG TPA: hypothetical protein [Caudoviricetes sp.]
MYAGCSLFTLIIPNFIDLSHFLVAFFIYATVAAKRYLPRGKGNATRKRPSGRNLLKGKKWI